MTSSIAYKNYTHTIRSAYNSLNLLPSMSDDDLGIFSYSLISNSSPQQILSLAFERAKNRLGRISTKLVTDLLDAPLTRTVFFNNTEIFVPIINKQGLEWYGNSSIYNFDFVVESFLGMHKGARTIYDIGGHQGIWALYYSLICGSNGRVYTFEPSIINIECSSILFLINNIENVVSIPFGVGDKTGIIEKQNSGMLVDFVEHNLGLMRFDNIFWESADFIKIDIEGFEFELFESFDKMFDFCLNMHLELHIPHLINRGLDYRLIYHKIPFEKVKVLNYQHGKLTEVGPNDSMDGFCSLLISKRT